LLISAFDYHLEGGRYIQENSFLGYSLRNSITTHGNLPLNIEYRDNLLKSNLDDILEGNFNTYINPTVTMQRYIEKDEEYIYDEVNVFSLLEEEAYIYNLRSLEGGGKTTLLKKSYLKMHELGKIPIFIDGSELKNISTVNFLAFLEEAYKKQYSTRVHGDYYLIPEDKFILMIDDIEKVNSNQNNVRNVLEYIVGGYKKVIFTSKNKFLNDNITIDNLGIQELYLKEFGHAQTHELICGWAKNLEPSSVNDESQLVVHFKDLFEEMKQKNNVPRTPTFLSILFEAFQDNNYQEIIDGTRVDFYKYIHEKIQKKISLQAKLNPDFVENLLKEIAYNLFTKKYNFSSDEFLEFMVKEYEYKRVKFYSSVERFLNVTENLKILSSNYVFNNEYSYHYYVASYLTYNLNDNIEEILKLIEDLSIHENLEIINFIIYFTGDSRILDKIKEILDKMFVEFPEFDLDDQARVLAPFFKLPKEIGKEGHIPERKRQEFYESLDSKKKEIEKVKKKHKLEKKTDFQKNISKSYGLMDLIEQLMKKHGDKLSGKHKKDLIKGAIQLGLRICQTAMYVYFKKIKHAMQIEKEEEIRELIPKLASIIDYLIHKISIKIGSIKCEISLLKVLDKYDYYTKEVLKLYYYNEYGLVEKERLKTDLYGSLYRNAQKSFHNFVSVSLYANYLRISRYLGITDEINFELLSKMGIDGRSRAKLLQEARESKKTIESKKEIN
jgi:ribosomal protein S21